MTLANDTDGMLAEPSWSDGEVGDYIALLKPRVMSLVIFTALVSMVAAPSSLNPVLAAISLIAIAAGAGGAGALNMWYDAPVDASMRRTRARPIPSGRLHRGDALGLGLILSVFSVFTLGLAANWLAAGLLASTIVFYAVIYTMGLKTLTAQNIVIGGAAGALPPVVGWAAMTGSVSLEPLLYFLVIFMWTPPHFWALALFAREDYAEAGIPMMPNVAGEDSTRRQILIYALLLAPVGALPWLISDAGLVYGIAAILLGGEFIRRAILLVRRGDADRHRAAKSLFGYSIVYLFGLFAVRLVEALATGLIGV